jgi:hypothetical protein
VTRSRIVAILLCVSAGCAAREGDPGAEARRASFAAERKALDESLDRLEERLLGEQARVSFWTELQARHGAVSQLACKNLEEHARAVARLDGDQRPRQGASAKKSRIAARTVSGDRATR